MWDFKRDIFRSDDGLTGTTGVTIFQYVVNYSANNGVASSTTACSGPSSTFPIWTTASTVNAIVMNTVMYGDVNMVSSWNGGGLWYGITNIYAGTPINSLQIDNVGSVLSVISCAPTYATWDISTLSSAIPANACSATLDGVVYSAPVSLANVTIFYNTPLLTTPFVGDNNYWHIREGASLYSILIGVGGEASNLTIC